MVFRKCIHLLLNIYNNSIKTKWSITLLLEVTMLSPKANGFLFLKEKYQGILNKVIGWSTRPLRLEEQYPKQQQQWKRSSLRQVGREGKETTQRAYMRQDRRALSLVRWGRFWGSASAQLTALSGRCPSGLQSVGALGH